MKRVIFWGTWERYSDRYSSYKEFKAHWDTSTKLRKVMINDLRKDWEKEKHNIKLVKNTIAWILNRRNPN
jgi:hypothetical protein